MLPALVLGDTSTVTLTSREFRAAGLTHLTAVSPPSRSCVRRRWFRHRRDRNRVPWRARRRVGGIRHPGAADGQAWAAVMGAIAPGDAGLRAGGRRFQLVGSVLVAGCRSPSAVDIGFAPSGGGHGLVPVWSRRLVDLRCRAGRCSRGGRAAGDGATGAAISGRVAQAVGQSGGGGRDRADHRAGRSVAAVLAAAGRRAGADPVHRGPK